jgi:hypothetical protein
VLFVTGNANGRPASDVEVAQVVVVAIDSASGVELNGELAVAPSMESVVTRPANGNRFVL